jgi:hypothetical protein
MLPVGEILQRIHGVITDRNNTEPLFPDRLQVLFQLDELNLAERSPVGGTEKDNHGTLRSHDRFERLVSPVLVACRKRGNGLARGRSSLNILSVECRDWKHPRQESFFSHTPVIRT